MLAFLKRFGLGIFYTVVSPFLLAFFIIWILYTIVIFFVKLFSGLYSFFIKGKKEFFSLTPEEEQAQKILSTLEAQTTVACSTAPQTNQTINFNFAPGTDPKDILNELNNLNNNNNQQINNLPPENKEIETQNIKEIDLTKNNNGGNAS